ncbi:MAG: hypothetical protein GYB33_00950 [Gammaproteobacteria bacterium]|uniref:hypothetical protein n=1 Tax=Pseudomaricurvus alcaniphilus TaxID=1166482 RepID=UPI00140E0F6C|nr:hypothetical protein [Pseudomaricurvus alcaniphilus]MBR9908899.1 hypothetical protein [Gammaproteobacteria bacterium]NHN37952.1 hypothetical protein [Pseudomaricurvus alcaniphilus]
MQNHDKPTPLRAKAGAATYSANLKYSQLCQRLVQLRDQLHKHNPRLAKPTGAMIEHLVFNCPLQLLEDDDWQTVIYRVLCYLEVQMSPANDARHYFIRSDRDAPLFPNEELFDEHDAFLFAKVLLHFQRTHSG